LEIDGRAHHEQEDAFLRDRRRDLRTVRYGLQILRLSDEQVWTRWEDTRRAILDALDEVGAFGRRMVDRLLDRPVPAPPRPTRGARPSPSSHQRRPRSGPGTRTRTRTRARTRTRTRRRVPHAADPGPGAESRTWQTLGPGERTSCRLRGLNCPEGVSPRQQQEVRPGPGGGRWAGAGVRGRRRGSPSGVRRWGGR